jgi:hypothetical protein
MSTTIKVAYKGINRQFRVSQDISFTQLAQHISQLFQVTGDVTLLYQDEDGDSVSVNSDLELREAFQYTGQDGKVRVELSVGPTPPATTEPYKAPTPPAAPLPTEPYKVTVATPTDSPVQEHDGDDGDEPMEPDTADITDTVTKEALTQRFLALLQQHNDVLTSHPMLAAHANTLADTVINEIQGDDNGAPAAEEHIEAVQALESVLQVMAEFQPQVFFVRRCGGRPFSPRFHPWHQQRMHPCAGRRSCNPAPRPTLEEQLAALADMGFTDTQRNKDYLERYDGHLGRVVELLTRQEASESLYE